MVDWAQRVIEEFDTAELLSQPVPEFCQQWACNQPVETWCPLCRAFFCKVHDELCPRRMHDCLRGKADA